MPEPTTAPDVPIAQIREWLTTQQTAEHPCDAAERGSFAGRIGCLLWAYEEAVREIRIHQRYYEELRVAHEEQYARAASAEAAVQRIDEMCAQWDTWVTAQVHAYIASLPVELAAPSRPADSDHYLTISAERGRLTARITCTASHEALCRLDCAVPGCTIEAQPPHLDHDGTRIHPHQDAGLCRVVEAIEFFDPMRSYGGLSGPIGTVPVDAYLTDDGPRWDLLNRPAADVGADWTARDEAAWRVQHSDNREPDAAHQIRAGIEQTRRDLDNTGPELDPSKPGFSPVHYVLALGDAARAAEDTEDGTP